MEELKIIIKILTILIAIVIYIGIWVSLVKDWDSCVRTGYGYPCFEKFLGNFYMVWIIVHMTLIAYIFVWAWS